jgi:transcriptional regulator with XRE-family HTH domain
MDRLLCDFSVLRDLRKRSGMSIEVLAEKSNVSPSIISKLERNCTTPEMDTLYKLAKIFHLTLSDLVSLAERKTSQRTGSEKYVSGDFHFERISYRNIRCMHAFVKTGEKVSKADHKDDYEICWVLSGKMRITLPGENLELSAGSSVQFDALLPHTYEALENAQIIIIHQGKDKRF